MNRFATIAALISLAFAGRAVAAPEIVRDIEVRPGVTERVLVHQGNEAAPVLMLLPGGDGHVFITPDGTVAEGDDFLIRARRLFWQRGLTTVVVDAPTDRQDENGLHELRASDWHARDLAQIARVVGVGASVWLVGTSRGAISAANALARVEGDFAGGVLSSTPTLPTRKHGATVFDVDLGAIRQRVLLLHHEADACSASPPEMLDRLAFELKNARVDRAVIGGGTSPGANPCRGLSHHGFFGAEKAAVDAIANFVTR